MQVVADWGDGVTPLDIRQSGAALVGAPSGGAKFVFGFHPHGLYPTGGLPVERFDSSGDGL
jgi:hypothetical protein